MDAKDLPGPLKIAILVKSLGTEVGNVIMEGLTPAEREAVIGQMAQLGSISPDLVEKIAQEFLQQSQRERALTTGGAPSAKAWAIS